MDSPLTSMNISLPDPLRRFVEGEVSRGGYSTVSEYIRELIRQDQKEKAKAKLDSELLAGLKSERPVELTADYLSRKKADLEKRARKAK